MESSLSTGALLDGIAVIGMAGRFPGANDLDAFWRNLCAGVESISFLSDQDLEASGVDPAWIGDSRYVKAAATLDGIDLFDADFFGIPAQEAELMDPQHRILLECAWEALESAGYSPMHYKGLIGVYTGSRISEYLLFNQQPPDLGGMRTESLITNFQRLVANDKDYLATRISFKLNLKGPSITLQTACSTSLVAVHVACQSLLNGESDLALAGGVSVRIPQQAGYPYTEGMVFSPDGHTRAFDVAAGGTLFGSGAGVVVLKRLKEALSDRDCIHAVIKSSAVNNDGCSSKAGYTAPSVDGQAEVIAQALALADVAPETVTYVETHGTATPLGDAVEIAALTQAFGAATGGTGYCAIGSVKTNIGHLVQAAGIAGLIKTVLMLRHKWLVPSLHFQQPNPHIQFSKTPFYVNTSLTEWNTGSSPRRAGVSSFGVGGTNAHVIVEEPGTPELVQNGIDRPLHLLCLSAKDKAALRELCRRYAAYFRRNHPVRLADACFTANAGRSHFGQRLALLADSSQQIVEGITAYLGGKKEPKVISSRQGPWLSRPKVGFLFTGQGSQYVGMARQLYETQPSFRSSLDRCSRILTPYLKNTLKSILYSARPLSLIDQTAYAQPALVALEYALAELWLSWGIRPDFVMGHSVGEYAAACIAGVFSLEDGVRLLVDRGRLMEQLEPPGEMAAVFASEAKVTAVLHAYAERVSIAAINGPENIVVSGDGPSVRSVMQQLSLEGIQSRLLNASRAFHSPLLEPVLDDFERLAAGINYSRPQIGWISNLTGELVDSSPIQATYWRRHAREPVQFLAGIETLIQQGCEILLEIGPNPTLVTLGRRCVREGSALWLASLKRGRDDWEQLLETLGVLYTGGLDIDWLAFDRDYPRWRIELPTYPFQRQRYWVQSAVVKQDRAASTRVSNAPAHPLLGRRLRSALQEIQFESIISGANPRFLGDHRLHGELVFPATAYVEMVRAAAAEVFGAESCVIENLVFREPLTLSGHEPQAVQTIITRKGDDRASFEILSLPTQGAEQISWNLHATGEVRMEPAHPTYREVTQPSLEDLQSSCPNELAVEAFYQQKRKQGMEHGRSFQGVRRLWHGAGVALGEIAPLGDAESQTGTYRVDPSLLDACLQVGEAAAGVTYSVTDYDTYYLPIICERTRILGPVNGRSWSCARVRPEQVPSADVRTFDFQVFDENGRTVMEIEGLSFNQIAREKILRSMVRDTPDDWCYKVDWKLQPIAASLVDRAREPGDWLIFADDTGVGKDVAQLLEAHGNNCWLIFHGEHFDKAEPQRYIINPRCPNHYQQVVDEARGSRPIQWRGVVHLWGLDAGLSEDAPESLLQAELELTTGSVLYLVQALSGVQSGSSRNQMMPPCLWITTRGAQTIEEFAEMEPDLVGLVQSPLWGLGRVIMRELPELDCRLIDLDPSKATEAAEVLFGELCVTDRETQIAFRGSKRYAARLVERKRTVGSDKSIPTPKNKPFHAGVDSLFRDNCTYLITGGLGGIGLRLADWMVTRGARHLCLLGRSAPSRVASEWLEKMQSRGIQVVVFQTDVSRREQLSKTLDKIGAAMPPLRGIVHAAGVVDDGVLQFQSWQRFVEVMAPKVQGAWNLHILTRHLPFDFFALFSSVSSLWGTPGQANYAAANVFLDALAHHRRALGLQAVSINWSSWAEVGMAAALGEHFKQDRAKRGLGVIGVEEGLQLFERILYEDCAQRAVIPVDWQIYLQHFTAGVPPYFSELLRNDQRQEKRSQPLGERNQLADRIRAANEIERPDLLLNHVRNELARALRVKPTELDPDTPLINLGIDSLMAIELRNRIHMDLGLDIPMVKFLASPSMAQIAAMLLNQLDSTSNITDEHVRPRHPEPIESAKVTHILSDIESL